MWHYGLSSGIDGLYVYITSLLVSLPPLYTLIYMSVIIQRFYIEIEIEKESFREIEKVRRSYTLGAAPSLIVDKLAKRVSIRRGRRRALSD